MFNPKELSFETIKVGIDKVNKRNSQVFVSAIIAGLFIGLGYFGYIVLASTPLLVAGKFYGSIIFSVGLAMIIIGGGDLFTGNCLITLGYFDKKYKLSSVFKNLVLVYLGNFVGALFLAVLLYYSSISETSKTFILNLSNSKVSLSFMEALSRGILCNVLVAMAVYLSYAAKTVSGKIIALMLPVTLFVVSGYEHSVANMLILPLAKFLGGDLSIIEILVNNLIPVTIGNFIGGGLILPVIYYFIYVYNKKLSQ